VTGVSNARRRWLGAALAGLAAAGLAGCDKLGLGASKPSFHGVDITGAEYGRKLDLADAEGKPRTLADFKGKVSVVFFGYTQCPDVCPTTMAELAAIKRAMGQDGERVQGIFVTVDPERDTPEVLKAYLAAFDPSFVALRGTPEQTAEAAREFKVFFAKVPGKTDASYTVDHTAGSYVIDTQGQLRLFERYGAPAQELQADLERLVKEG
jgi:protein SCO1/2